LTVILEKQGTTLRATDVEVVSTNGIKRVYKASKEIIITAGAYCSPTILLRSGIGAKEELAKLRIETQVDLPGVGINLIDHLVGCPRAHIFIFVGGKSSTNVDKDSLHILRSPQAQTTNDHFIYHANARANAISLWTTSKTGFLSTFPFGSFAYARLDERLSDFPLW